MNRRTSKILMVGGIFIAAAAVITIAVVLITNSALSKAQYNDNRINSSSSILNQHNDNFNQDIQSQEDIITSVLPANTELEEITIKSSMLTKGNLILIDKDCKVPEEYADADYPSIYVKGSSYVVRSTEMYLQQEALDKLQEMTDAAASDGIEGMLIVDGYRTQEKQQRLFDEGIEDLVDQGMSEEEATEKTAQRVAKAGYSEHQIGLALDFDLHKINYDDFADTDFAKWLDKNSWKYGYILSYPKKAEDMGVMYEPWHFRYVGEGHAKYIHDNGMMLNEYIEMLHEKGNIIIQDEDGNNKWYVQYIKAEEKGDTKAYIPKGSEYTVSGDNMGGYILTAVLE